MNDMIFLMKKNILNLIDEETKKNLINSYFENKLTGFILNSNSIEFERLHISIKDLKPINIIRFDNLIGNYLRNEKAFNNYRRCKLLVILTKNGNTDNLSLKILSDNKNYVKKF